MILYTIYYRRGISKDARLAWYISILPLHNPVGNTSWKILVTQGHRTESIGVNTTFMCITNKVSLTLSVSL